MYTYTISARSAVRRKKKTKCRDKHETGGSVDANNKTE